MIKVPVRVACSWPWIRAPGLASILLSCSAIPPPPQLKPASAVEVMGGGSVADAQDDAPEPAELPVGEAIRLALQRSPRVREALARFDEAAAEARQARRLPNPTLQLSLRFNSFLSGLEGDASLLSDLVAGLTREGRSLVADERLRAACLDVVVHCLDERDAVREAYLRAQAAEAAIPLLREESATLARLRELAEQRRAAGETPGSDVDAFQAERAALEGKIRDADREARAARIALARRIARPGSSASWSLDPLAEPTAEIGDLATWTNQALVLRPEIVAAERETLALEREAGLVGKPVLGVLEAGPTVEHRDTTSVGIAGSLTLPIFDDGSELRAAACSRIEASRQHAATLRLDAEGEVRSSWAEAESAREQIAQLESERLPALERRVVTVRGALAAGEAEARESLVAERDLIEARSRVVELLRLVQDAQRRLERAAGGVDPRVIEPAPARTGVGEGSNVREPKGAGK